MCGIAGFAYTGLDKDRSASMLEKMLESISHRGPDARGTWISDEVSFGHNRLSIIDLSVDGNQPMHHFDAVITYNGEIYNYLEIRAELEKDGFVFKTNSDTEVILASYRKYGRDCVSHFVGMWAFAIWDKKTNALFCSRDRFGIKPFFYIHSGSQFFFGSEYKALKQTPAFTKALNQDQILRGLQLGWNVYGDETYFECIQSLPSAHNLFFENGKATIERYWDIDLTKRFRGSREEKQAEFYRLFCDSIKLHMRADVEVGACLSGGLDSSAIASAVATLFPEVPLKTFTIFYEGKDGVDERPFANEVTKKYKSLKPFYGSPSEREVAEEFDRAIYSQDLPIAGSSPISQYFVMKLAHEQKVKVVMDGQGADEFLGGYMHSFYRLIGGLIFQLKLITAHKEFYGHVERQGFGFGKSMDVFLKSIFCGMHSEQFLYEYEFRNFLPFVGKSSEPVFDLPKKGGSALSEFLYTLTTASSLPSLLHFEDRNSMAFSIESRVPFLDHRLVEFVFSLENEDKIYRGETKSILRKSLGGFLPEPIRNRKDKKGFVTPGEVKWLRGSLNFLLDKDLKQLDYLNLPLAREVIHGFKQGENKNANLVWRLAVLNYWLEKNG